MTKSRGKYIVIEGQDGTGKTTQADLLQKLLESQGISVVHIKEPGGSPVAEAIRDVILNGNLARTPMTNALLFTANRHELWHSVIEPALSIGTWVICTRNYWSTLAYQGYGEGMDTNIITAITSTFTDIRYMTPDMSVILLYKDLDERKRRIAERNSLVNPDTFESKDPGFQDRVDAGYSVVADKFDIPVIEAGDSIAAVHEKILVTFNLNRKP